MKIYCAMMALGFGLSVGLRAECVQDGFTASIDVDLSRVTTNVALYSFGSLKVCLRQAGRDGALRKYDIAQGNYLNFPVADGTCPVIEATICEKGGRVGIPLGLLAPTSDVRAVTVNWTGVHLSILVDGHLDDDMPPPGACDSFSNCVEKVLSPRVKEVHLSRPARMDAIPVMPDSRLITGTPQFWTPSGHNAWVGDVAVGVWKGRFHVFYLLDRRHHCSGAGAGRHYFAHLSSSDLVSWFEHPHSVPIESWWETIGTGTPFEYNGKWCLAYGLHTGRLVPKELQIYAHFNDLPPEKRGDGNFTFDDLPKAIPAGGTYVESDDGIHFRKTGIYITGDQNPTVYGRADGRLGLATNNGQLFYSKDGKIGHWVPDGDAAPVGGDCPAVFAWGGRDYLLQGFYWMASRGTSGVWENWTASGDDIYDGINVPMVAAWKDDRRILAGWIGHPFGWGGWLVFRELVRFSDGKLGTKWLKEAPPPGEVREFAVTDVTKPFVLRAICQSGCEDIELRIDPAKARAQFAYPQSGKTGVRALTAAEILAARSLEKRFATSDQDGDFAFKGGSYAIGKIRGLDKPFTVRVAQYHDVKGDTTIFDVEIAGVRTMLARRLGRFNPMSRVDGVGD